MNFKFFYIIFTCVINFLILYAPPIQISPEQTAAAQEKLAEAIRNNSPEQIAAADLAVGSSLNAVIPSTGLTPLALAVFIRNGKAIDYILSKTFDANNASSTITTLSYRPDANEPGKTIRNVGSVTPLILAVANNDKDTVRKIIDKLNVASKMTSGQVKVDAALHFRTTSGHTPLAIANYFGHTDMANYLKERGARY